MQNEKTLSGEDVKAFCAEIRQSGIAQTDREICRMLGVVPTSLVRYKKKGVEKVIALAFAAILSEIPPYAPPVTQKKGD